MAVKAQARLSFVMFPLSFYKLFVHVHLWLLIKVLYMREISSGKQTSNQSNKKKGLFKIENDLRSRPPWSRAWYLEDVYARHHHFYVSSFHRFSVVLQTGSEWRFKIIKTKSENFVSLLKRNLVIADIFIFFASLHFVIRGTQRLFSVKYLFGEANIA